MKKIIINILIIIAVFIVLFMIFRKKGIELEYISPISGIVRSTISLEGEVVPANEVTYISIVSGKIVEIPESDAEVKENELLFKIDDTSLQHKLNSVQLQINSINSEINYSEEEVAKLKLLSDAGAIPDAEFRNAEQKLISLKNQIKILNEEMNSLKHGMANYVQYAPFTGTVVSVNIKKDEIAVPGKPIMTFADLTNKEIKCYIKPAERSMIKDGLQAIISSPVISNLTVSGEVTKISLDKNFSTSIPAIDSDKEDRFQIIISYDNSTADFNVGFKVMLDIIREEKECANIIPLQSIIISEDNKNFVITAEKNKLNLKEVVTGLSDDENVEVKEGVSGQDKIIMNPHLIEYNLKSKKISLKRFSLKKYADQ